jgi:hypothetical protein
MRWGRKSCVVLTIGAAACAHDAPPTTEVAIPAVSASAPVAPPSASAVAMASADSEAQGRTPARTDQDDSPPVRLPQSDPIPPPAPKCPNVAALVSASAIVKREAPPRGVRTSPAQDVLDIEITLTLPANAAQVVLMPNAMTVYGGVLFERTRTLVDPTKAVLLVRPSGTVAREGSLLALFGLTCPGAQGTLRVMMAYALPPKDGDKVMMRSITAD